MNICFPSYIEIFYSRVSKNSTLNFAIIFPFYFENRWENSNQIYLALLLDNTDDKSEEPQCSNGMFSLINENYMATFRCQDWTVQTLYWRSHACLKNSAS